MKDCHCTRKGFCVSHEHTDQGCVGHAHITLSIGQLPGHDGPPCIWCNAPTRRTGACFTCIACGATTSC